MPKSREEILEDIHVSGGILSHVGEFQTLDELHTEVLSALCNRVGISRARYDSREDMLRLLEQVAREHCIDVGLEVTPDVQAAYDQYAAEMRDHPPVKVDFIQLYMLMNRYSRLKKLRAMSEDMQPPQLIIDHQWKLIEEALEAMLQYVKEHDTLDGYYPPNFHEVDD